MNILIISGGNASERKISLISAGEVKNALEKNGHFVRVFDFRKGYPALKKILPKFDIIFPVLHGEEGEGGSLQKFLRNQGKLYIGGHHKGFKQGWYKIPFKKFCQKHNIPTAPWKIVKNQSHILQFGFPSVLKASSGGSSKEVVILKSKKDLENTLCRRLLKSGVPLFIEKHIPGIEVTVGILGDKALPVIEIIPPEGRWFDYKRKYSGETKEIIDAPSLSPAQRETAQQTALKIHQKLNLGPYSRIDFIVSNLRLHPKGGKLIPYVLEVNTIPGLTPQSLFPKAAQAAGLSFEQFIEQFVIISYKWL